MDMSKSVYTKDYKEIINRLKQARIDAGLSQQVVAGKLGKPQSYVSKIESGERRLDVADLAQDLQERAADLRDELRLGRVSDERLFAERADGAAWDRGGTGDHRALNDPGWPLPRAPRVCR